MENLLEVQGLRVSRDRTVLLDGVDLSVKSGTLHVLVGPNGAGKSTLLRAVLGQVPFTGTVRCGFRREGTIGYVPQRLDFDVELPMTVREFLALGRQRLPVCLGVGGAARAHVAEALALVGLAHLAQRRLGVLSGGELQRVLLARAILPAPELLLLDEPTAGVDVEALAAVERVLLELKGRGVTTLMVSHDPEQVARVADGVTRLAPPKGRPSSEGAA